MKAPKFDNGNVVGNPTVTITSKEGLFLPPPHPFFRLENT